MDQSAEPLRTLAEKVDPRHAAVIVVDVLNDFCSPGGYYDKGGADLALIEPAVDRMCVFLRAAREAKVMVIFVRSHYDPIYLAPAQAERRQRLGWEAYPCREGTWGADFYKVAPAPGDPVITKHRYDSFYNTDLDLILRSNGRRSLLFIGVATNVCVETAIRSAFMRDYYPVLVEDCAAARTRQFHEAAVATIGLHFGLVASSTEVASIWAGKARPQGAAGERTG